MYRALCALNANGSASAHASSIGEPGLRSLLRSPEWTGAEIAEIATCVAAGGSRPLVLACPARGARIASGPIVSPPEANIALVANAGRVIDSEGRRLTSATLAAMDALLTRTLNGATEDASSAVAREEAVAAKNARRSTARKKKEPHPREDAAIVCAGLLDSGDEAERDYRAAFGFASRHKLPILYVIANRLAPSPQGKPLDLRSIYPEFGIPLFTVDANDAVAAYRVATEALHNARHLRGPSVIEALALAADASSASALELLIAYMERHGNAPRNS
jgi:hypothetical protein